MACPHRRNRVEGRVAESSQAKELVKANGGSWTSGKLRGSEYSSICVFLGLESWSGSRDKGGEIRRYDTTLISTW